MSRVITWNEWMKGRAERRKLCQSVAPGINRRKESSSDKRLKKTFKGKRGMPFASLKTLSSYAKKQD